MYTANSGGGVEDDDRNLRITICGISLIFGSCRLYKNFATVILFQMISPTATIISVVSTRNGTRKVAAIAPSDNIFVIIDLYIALECKFTFIACVISTAD